MFVTWIAVALATAGVAAGVMKYGGHGIKADVLLALAGSGLASVATAALDLFPQSGLAATAVVAFAGAGVAIAVQRRFFHAPAARVDDRRWP